MKKLFYIFAVLATTLNTTAWGDDDFLKDFNKFKEEMFSSQSNLIAKMNQDGCLNQKEIEGNDLWMFGPGSLPKNCQEIIISLTNQNGPYTQQDTGDCNGKPYTCNPGDLPSNCNPCKIGQTLFNYRNDIANEYKKLACENNPTTDQSSSEDQQKWMTIACNKLASTTKVTKQISTTKTNITSDENKIASAPTNPKTQKTTSSNASSTETIAVSGTVYDDTGPAIGVNVYAIDSDGKTIQTKNSSIGATTDINGHFEIKNFPSNARLRISFVGFDTQIFTVDEWNKQGKKHTLKVSDNELQEVEIKSCKAQEREKLNAKDTQIHIDSNNCIPISCKNGFALVTPDNKPYTHQPKCLDSINLAECTFTQGIKCIDITGNCTDDKHADTSEYVLKNGTYECEIKTCKSGYKPNDVGSACIKMAKKCNDNDRKKLEDAGASDTGLRTGTETCIALDCKCGYTLNGEECTPWEKDKNGKYTKPCEESDLEKLNAISGILACNDRGKAFCEITECISSDYTHNTEKNTCDSKNKTPCDTMPENATDAEYRTVDGKLVCIINKCADGYERDANKTKCNPTPKLSEENSLKKIDELQQNADAMRAKEQSTANKLLGGATMAATGIGGMQLASALSEQQSDEDAERAMRAYLATFHCNYGGGKNVQGGEKDIELPGGNELIGLYSEYVNLANDLKVRKNALGMKPGIESESILDSATSGLYDDVSIGKTSGAFTSLARALQDPNGADAAAWAEQKSASEKKLKTGATIAGIGAVGGAVGNLLINKNAPQEKSKEINQKYEKLKKIIVDTQPKIDAIPPKKCSEFDGTNPAGVAPNCTCNDDDARFFPDQGGCIKCENGMEYNNSNECVKPGCTLTRAIDAEKCACVTNATKNNKDECICNDGYDEVNGTCTEQQTQTTPPDKPQPQVLANLKIKADTTFASGSAEITPDAQKVFKDSLVSELQKNSDLSKIDQYCIYITGHTDRTKFKSTSKKTNQLLSEQRAAAIAKIFTDAGISKDNIKSEGMADKDCKQDIYPQQNEPKCRRVDVQIVSDTCDNANSLSQITNNINLDNLISGFTKN